MRRLAAAVLLCVTVAGTHPAGADIIHCDERACVTVSADHVPKPRRAARGRSVSLAGVVPELAAKARSIVAACNAKVISAVRRTRIAGTRRMSLHAYGRAVDLAGHPACIYAHLRQWPGGMSTDYARVRHVHLSFDPQGREWGRRFAHYRASRRNIFRRYAMRRR